MADMNSSPMFILLTLFTLILHTHGVNGTIVQDDETIDDMIDVEEEVSAFAEDELFTGDAQTASVDADTTILFTKPTINPASSLELPGGRAVELLIGFTNRGKLDFVLETLETSLRYPMDFKFYIQNFTDLVINKVVKPNHEATLQYSFIPSESFAGRPFGLNVNLIYKDSNGFPFSEAVYNETVQIIELDEGLDGETVFLYVFLAACVILTLVGGQQLLSSLGKKSRSMSLRKQAVEKGTSNPNNVDFDWLPRETLNRFNRSPKTPKQSPRQRKMKRSTDIED